MDILAAFFLGLSLAGSVSAQDLKVLSEPDAQKAAAAINSANAGVKSLKLLIAEEMLNKLLRCHTGIARHGYKRGGQRDNGGRG